MLALLIAEFYPGLAGAELRAKLHDYAALGFHSLGYEVAREHMYSYIYNDPNENAVHCVYTDLAMPCAYGSMSTQCNPDGDLNCEHTVPQSCFGSKEPVKSDVYNLRPTWKSANSGRSNYSFGEIPQAEYPLVNKWFGNYHQVNTKGNVPDQPELFSAEYRKQPTSESVFMPQESQKGETARIVAYFYVMWEEELQSLLDRRAFLSIDEMIEWDLLYRPTPKQLQFAQRSLEVQGNHNPFMEEEGLVYRAYCDLSEGKYPCK